jgi:hypothetical protein
MPASAARAMRAACNLEIAAELMQQYYAHAAVAAAASGESQLLW